MDDLKDEGQGATSSEQAADFAALQRMAAEGEAVPGAEVQAGEAAPAPAGPPLSEEISGVLKLVAGMIKPALPTVAEIYTPEVCDSVGGAVGAVCDKHGWLQGGISGKYGEEIMCLAVVGPIAYATVEAAKSDIAARKAAAKPALQGTETGAAMLEVGEAVKPSEIGQKTVTFGAPVV
jgi:hypothetical protein